jgi:hypothetical protein
MANDLSILKVVGADDRLQSIDIKSRSPLERNHQKEGRLIPLHRAFCILWPERAGMIDGAPLSQYRWNSRTH